METDRKKMKKKKSILHEISSSLTTFQKRSNVSTTIQYSQEQTAKCTMTGRTKKGIPEKLQQVLILLNTEKYNILQKVKPILSEVGKSTR